jgi:hypothetical protein
MNEARITESPSWDDPRGQEMKTPEEVAAMVRLKACGWGINNLVKPRTPNQKARRFIRWRNQSRD